MTILLLLSLSQSLMFSRTLTVGFVPVARINPDTSLNCNQPVFALSIVLKHTSNSFHVLAYFILSFVRVLFLI